MRSRPTRQQVDPAALELVARHGAQILATARRYAATPEDAEDAYQRALEVLLTKAPTTNERELVPWLKTVVKHEAFALRRARERHSPMTDDGELTDPPAATADTPDRAERYERLRQGAEALTQLKPQEVRALLLKAEGYSYREISQITGWTYTKVNRCLTEGRRAFLRRVAGIEAGVECERLAPRLSALADGEASAEDLALLRPHMKSCLSCRARLREFRAAPARVAALMPPAALVALQEPSPLRSLIESLLGAAQHKTATLGERAYAAVEVTSANKVAAVAASAAALAGGGTAIDRLDNHAGPPRARGEVEIQPRERDLASAPAPGPAPEAVVAQVAPAPEPEPAPQPAPPPPSPQPADEFDPAAAARAAAGPQGAPRAPPAAALPSAAAPAAAEAPAPAPAESALAPASAGRASAAPGGEFAP